MSDQPLEKPKTGLGSGPGWTNRAGKKIPIEQIDRCLEANKGLRKPTADMLNMSVRTIHDIINQVPELKAKWAKWENPERAIGSAAPTDMELAVRIESQNNKFKDGIMMLGGSPKEAELLVAMRTAIGGSIDSMLGLTTAGVAVQFQRLLITIEKLRTQIDLAMEPDSGVEESKLKLMLESYQKLFNELTKAQRAARESSWVNAKISALLRKTLNGEPVNPKSSAQAQKGWKSKADVQVLAQPGSIVNLNPERPAGEKK